MMYQNMKNKVLVFDDIIDLKYQDTIKKILLSDYQYKGYEFPWYFTQDVTRHTDTNSQKDQPFIIVMLRVMMTILWELLIVYFIIC